ncbi:unnamed protein product, partial [Polarella glacialis]
VFKFRPSADEANPQRVALSALRAQFAEVPGEFGWEEPTKLSPWYNHKVNLMHVAMLDAADFFVQAQEAVNSDAKQSLFTQAWAHAANATSIEDVLMPVADSPTILFMSAHELYGMLLLMTGDKANAAMASTAFAKARSSQGPQLATRLGQARAKALAGLPCEAAAWYAEVLAMMDQASDKADLPFWAELQQGLAMCPPGSVTVTKVVGTMAMQVANCTAFTGMAGVERAVAAGIASASGVDASSVMVALSCPSRRLASGLLARRLADAVNAAYEITIPAGSTTITAASVTSAIEAEGASGLTSKIATAMTAANIDAVNLTVTSVPAPKEAKTTVSTTAATSSTTNKATVSTTAAPSRPKPSESSARQVFTGSLAAVLAMAMAAFA